MLGSDEILMTAMGNISHIWEHLDEKVAGDDLTPALFL